MVNTKTTVSKKVLAIVLAVACMVAFTPAMAFTSSAHAAAWKVSPTKATVYVGKYKTLKSTKTAKWTSSKKSVAKLTASKGKTVKVKGVKAGKATIKVTYKGTTKKIAITVKKAITGVTVTGTAKVGEVLTATTTPASATAKYQWYADGAAISGATAKTFTVTAATVGKALTVKVTGTSSYGGSKTSAATAAVAKNTFSVAVSGMTGTTTTAYDTALVGDTLSATTTPAAAKDVVTYQWYRGTNAIANSTGATYVVTANDNGAALHVVATITKDGAAGYNNTTAASTSVNASQALASDAATITMGSGDPLAASAYTATVTLKAGTAAADITGYTATWYYEKADGTVAQASAALSFALNSSNVYTATTTATPTAANVGKTMVLVVKRANYTGTITATSSAIKTAVTAVAADKDTADLTAGVTTLTATTTPADATVSYQWYETVNGIDSAIAGATSKTYEIPATATGTVSYKVQVKGTGNYSGTTTSAPVTGTISTAAVNISAVTIQKDGKAVGATVSTGDTLTAITTPAKASSSVTYTWYKGDTVLGTGSTYKVENALAGSEITVKATLNSGVTMYEMTSSPVAATAVKVSAALTSVKLAYTNGLASTATGYATYATPSIGNTVVSTLDPASADVTYSFYLNSNAYPITLDDTNSIATTAAASGKFVIPAEVTIDTAQVATKGQKIIVIATGKSKSNYAGSTTQATTDTIAAASTVKTIKTVTVSKSGVAITNTNGSNVQVGDVLTAKANDATPSPINSGVTYTWTVGGAAVKADTAVADGSQYTVKDSDAGKAITVTATSSDATLATGTATWDNFGRSVALADFNAIVSNGTTAATAATSRFTSGDTINVSVPTGYTATYSWSGQEGTATNGSYTLTDKDIAAGHAAITVTVTDTVTNTNVKTVTFTYHVAAGGAAAYYTYAIV